jgi:hypothetical protein
VLASVVIARAWQVGAIRACADEFFVDPAGSDAAAGTFSAPWQTLQHAADVVGPGDRVTVRPGTYAGFYMDSSGTPGDPIEFLALPGALVNAPNGTTPDGINLEGASYVIIDGFEVAGMPRTGVRTVGFPDDFAESVTIRNVYAHDNGRWGILTGHVDDLLIESNRMAGSIIEHGIYVSNSGDRPVVRNNLVWGNNRSGIQLNSDLSQGGDGIISDAVVSGNVIFNNGVEGGSALNFDGVQDSRVENNLLYNNHASGISLYRIDGAQGASGNLVVNNTIHQADDGRWAVNIQNASTNNTLRNNILVTDHISRGAIDISADSLPAFSSDYNVVTPRFTASGGGSTLSLAQWQAATGQDSHSQAADVDDLFLNPTAGNYHLQPDAVAGDAGLPTGAPPIDLVGHPRPYGPGVDIGALERILPGDYNADGTVNAADYPVWRNSLNQIGFALPADGNGDGTITRLDYDVWKAHYGETFGSGSAADSANRAVPEPPTQVLCWLAAIACALWERRRR